MSPKTKHFLTSILCRLGLDFGSILGSKNRLKIFNFRKNGGSKMSFEALWLWSHFLDGFPSLRSSILQELDVRAQLCGN